jgi:hypothetical protein
MNPPDDFDTRRIDLQAVDIANQHMQPQRDRQIAEIRSAGRFQWKRMFGYYAQSIAENAFSRYKKTFGGQLRAKRDEAQEREASLPCTLLNRLRALGRPQSYPMS